MALPFFYKEDIQASLASVVLDEDTSKHIVQVLRMQNGEPLQLTNGRGDLFTCEITDNNRKRCSVKILQTSNLKGQSSNITIAISLIKNSSRFEWFLEKATELGVSEIVPLICERTEKTAFKAERMKSILVSAMLQSQQVWLPVLSEPVEFDEFITLPSAPSKYIAHCMEGEKESLSAALHTNDHSTVILIGPEGDFTPEEVSLATTNGYKAVSLGQTRLRTETAGVAAAVLVVSL